MTFSSLRTVSTLTAVAAIAGTASLSAAATVLQIDLNNFSVTSASATDGYTLSLFNDANTEIEDIAVDGNEAPGFVEVLSPTFVGDLQLEGSASEGKIVGGTYVLSDNAGNTFSFSNITGTYQDTGTMIQLALFMRSNTGVFSSDVFAGVDVSDFAGGGLPVGAIGFNFDRSLLTNVGSTDSVVDTDIIVTIPSPTAATAGLGLMGVMALGKRRRKA